MNSKLGWRRHTVVRSVNSVMRLLPPTSMPVKYCETVSERSHKAHMLQCTDFNTSR